MQWIDADADGRVSAGNRGLAYGDGLFETMRVIDGRIRFIESHMQRLERGCDRLGIAMPDPTTLAPRLQSKAGAGRCDWVKMIVTRGEGGRGYACDDRAVPVVVVSSGNLSATKARWRLKICTTALADDAQLAGIKHLNRLAQVMARREWAGGDYDEGVMCDAAGNIACGIMSNVFSVYRGNIVTPRIDRAGVAGVMRGWVLQNANVATQRIRLDTLIASDEIFVTNALRGVVSASQVGGIELPASTPVADTLRLRLEAVTT